MSITLRPLEKRILEMRDQGLSYEEIGRRVGKSAERVAMIADWTELPGRGEGKASANDDLLTPIERRVLAMRSEGQSFEEIGRRFRRTPRFVKQVAGLAHFRQFRELLG